jgi:hypothetical protein
MQITCKTNPDSVTHLDLFYEPSLLGLPWFLAVKLLPQTFSVMELIASEKYVPSNQNFVYLAEPSCYCRTANFCGFISKHLSCLSQINDEIQAS